MNMTEEFTVPQAASYLNVSQKRVVKKSGQSDEVPYAGGSCGSSNTKSLWSLPAASIHIPVKWVRHSKCSGLMTLTELIPTDNSTKSLS